MKAYDKRILIEKLVIKYHSKCAYCGVYLSRKKRTIDHYLPVALGGSNEFENCRLACSPCNGAKGSMHPDEWAKIKPSVAIEETPVKIALLQYIAQRQREQFFAAREKALIELGLTP